VYRGNNTLKTAKYAVAQFSFHMIQMEKTFSHLKLR
jgi:hypothetical protein